MSIVTTRSPAGVVQSARHVEGGASMLLAGVTGAAKEGASEGEEVRIVGDVLGACVPRVRVSAAAWASAGVGGCADESWRLRHVMGLV